MKNIAVIPARSGSKGLKDKNIKMLSGKPLLAYSVEAALKSGEFDTVHVSTDSKEYAEIAREMPIMREEPFLPDIRQINPLHLARIHQTPVIILPRSWNLKILPRRHIIPDCLPFRPQMT